MKYVVAAGLCAVSFSILTARAEESTATPTPTASEKVRDAITRCDAIELKLKTRVTNQKQAATRFGDRYTAIIKGVGSLITKADAADYDTTKVKADLASLKTKVATYQTDKTAYVTALEATKEYTCGKSEGLFKTALEDARAKLKVVEADVKDIRTLVLGDLKTDVKALRLTATAAAKAAKTPVAAATAGKVEVAQ